MDHPTTSESKAAGPQSPPPGRMQALVPTIAVLAVAVAAIAAAVMSRHEHEAAPPQWVERGISSPLARAVVQAPPAVVTAPPLRPAPRAPGTATANDTRTMGAAPGCRNCGTIESVAVSRSAPARAFEMRIQMDDGSTRTIEQRGALAAGSRVVLEGSSVRTLGSQG